MLILTIVITTSLAVFFDRQKRLLEAGESVRVWQALANEAEARRHQPFGGLVPGADQPFLTDLAILEPLAAPVARVVIEAESPFVRRLTLRIEWAGGMREASIAVYRTRTGGGPLW